MKDLLKFLITSLVEKPEKVKIKEEVQAENINLTCQVDKEDMGKIIGREGRTIKAIRNLLRSKAGRKQKKVSLVLEEKTS